MPSSNESVKGRLFRGTRMITIYEDVEVFASSYDEARELIEDDDETVVITGERDNDYEIDELHEVKE